MLVSRKNVLIGKLGNTNTSFLLITPNQNQTNYVENWVSSATFEHFLVQTIFSVSSYRWKLNQAVIIIISMLPVGWCCLWISELLMLPGKCFVCCCDNNNTCSVSSLFSGQQWKLFHRDSWYNYFDNLDILVGAICLHNSQDYHVYTHNKSINILGILYLDQVLKHFKDSRKLPAYHLVTTELTHCS